MASGDSLLSWNALSNEPPDDAIATLDFILTTSTDEPDDVVPVLDFDPGATQEYAVFSAHMPAHYDGGGVTLILIWTSEATTGNVKWDAAFKRYADSTNLLSKTYATEQTATTTTDGTARDINTTTITFTNGTQMDSITVEELFHLLVTRDSADSSDTMNSNDAELISVYLKET
jgi:hypothetical protein